MSTNEPQRVAKLMAQRGMCSRREAERLIEVGAVQVDGVVMREQGCKARPNAEISLNGHGSRRLAAHTTVLLHKPVGIVSTQAEGEQIAAWSLLQSKPAFGDNDPEALERVLAKPWTMSVCGRLDRESRGLLILTQNGVLAKLLTGGHQVEKHYVVTCDRPLREADLRRLRGDWVLDGKALQPMQVQRAAETTLRFTLVEGRKHQIRRVCAECDLNVVDLLREGIGPWHLGKLPEGRWQVVPGEEVEAFIRAQPAAPKPGRSASAQAATGKKPRRSPR